MNSATSIGQTVSHSYSQSGGQVCPPSWKGTSTVFSVTGLLTAMTRAFKRDCSQENRPLSLTPMENRKRNTVISEWTRLYRLRRTGAFFCTAVLKLSAISFLIKRTGQTQTQSHSGPSTFSKHFGEEHKGSCRSGAVAGFFLYLSHDVACNLRRH